MVVVKVTILPDPNPMKRTVYKVSVPDQFRTILVPWFSHHEHTVEKDGMIFIETLGEVQNYLQKLSELTAASKAAKKRLNR